MNTVTIENYFPKYFLYPLSKELSKTDQAICLIASVVLGTLTFGLLHLGAAIYQWNQKRVNKEPSQQFVVNLSKKQVVDKDQQDMVIPTPKSIAALEDWPGIVVSIPEREKDQQAIDSSSPEREDDQQDMVVPTPKTVIALDDRPGIEVSIPVREKDQQDMVIPTPKSVVVLEDRPPIDVSISVPVAIRSEAPVLPDSVERLREELNGLLGQIQEEETKRKLVVLAGQIYACAKEMLNECDPEIGAIILENVENELNALISIAKGLIEDKDVSKHKDALCLSLEKETWVDNMQAVLSRVAIEGYTRAHAEKFEELCKQSADQNIKALRWDYGTILHYIAKKGKPIEFVEILAKHRIDFNIQDKHFDDTALIWAIANAQNEMANTILDYPQDLNLMGFGNAALHVAIAKGYKDRSACGKALKLSNLQLVEKMVQKGANPNLKNKLGYTPLHLACIRRDPGMIKALLDAGGDRTILSSDKKTCLELLQMSYEEANTVLKNVTSPHLLPEEEFHANQQECLDLLSQ